MSTSVIRQVVNNNNQVIKQIVKDSERGATGPQGETGQAATVEAGSAYSLPYGSAPSVMNTGTSSAAKFDFYIPEGKKGDTGTAPIIMTSIDPGEGSPLENGMFIAVYDGQEI